MIAIPVLGTRVPAPSTPLGPFEDSAVSWASWVTLMSFVGLVSLALVVAAPAHALGDRAARVVRGRLAWAAIAAGVLAFPAVLSDHARGGSGYDFGSAWSELFDGTTAGLLAGFQTFLPIIGALILVPVVLRRVLPKPLVTGLRLTALVLGVVALGATRFPATRPADLGLGIFQTVMWMLHLMGGAVWVGGLLGLVVLALRSGLDSGFWPAAIRRFAAAATGCVAAIALSGLFMYWEHVDGPTQLVTTMYGRVLGVKILLFGGLLVLGAVNQFWLHPRIDALRAAGDERPLRTILARRFPAVVGVEVVMILTLLFVAPFLHGSARNQAYQADAAKHATAPHAKLPKLSQKEVWKLGQTRTVSQGNITPFLACGFDKPPTVHAQSEVYVNYTASFDGSTGSEAVYHYASAAAAQQDYDVLKAIPAGCKTSRMGVSISSGLAWQDTNDGAAMHMMLVKSGPDIAFWLYQYQGSTPYDTSDDQAALQRMADRLDGGTPAPDPITAPPANVIPGSAWLDLTQIPFGTADQSHGWYLMGAQQSGQGSVAPTDLCASAAFVVDGKDAVDVFRNYHGTPTSTPVYPGSNYLYSSAVQTIATFPSENRATAAFDTGRQVTQLTGCTFKDPSGEQTNRTIKVGATNPTGFSLLVNDKPGASYEHVYVVLKGTHVSTLMVNFEQGDTSTSGDAAVLATMEAQLP